MASKHKKKRMPLINIWEALPDEADASEEEVPLVNDPSVNRQEPPVKPDPVSGRQKHSRRTSSVIQRRPMAVQGRPGKSYAHIAALRGDRRGPPLTQPNIVLPDSAIGFTEAIQAPCGNQGFSQQTHEESAVWGGHSVPQACQDPSSSSSQTRATPVKLGTSGTDNIEYKSSSRDEAAQIAGFASAASQDSNEGDNARIQTAVASSSSAGVTHSIRSTAAGTDDNVSNPKKNLAELAERPTKVYAALSIEWNGVQDPERALALIDEDDKYPLAVSRPKMQEQHAGRGKTTVAVLDRELRRLVAQLSTLHGDMVKDGINTTSVMEDRANTAALVDDILREARLESTHSADEIREMQSTDISQRSKRYDEAIRGVMDRLQRLKLLQQHMECKRQINKDDVVNKDNEDLIIL